MRRWLLVVWLALITDACFAAPSARPSPPGLFWRMLTFDRGIEPSLIALFYAVGVVVSLHGSFLLAERDRALPQPGYALVAGLVLGSFALLPYYALRRRAGTRSDPPTWPASPYLRGLLVAELAACGLCAVTFGHFAEFWQEVTSRRFSHVLLLDFVILCALLPALASKKLGP